MAFGDNGELMTLGEFMEAFGPRRIIEVSTERDAAGNSPWIVIRSGQFTAVLVPQDLDGEYLNIDAHPFVDGLGATASVFAMSGGRDVPGLAPTGTTSYGRPSAQLVAVIIGEQGTTQPEPGQGWVSESGRTLKVRPGQSRPAFTEPGE